MPARIPFIDLERQKHRLQEPLRQAMEAVFEHGQFIMGPEVAQLESRLADFTGAAEVVTCASGTDALVLVLRALQVGPGDAVVVPAFTFAATAEAVALVGATPVFADSVPATYCMDPEGVKTGADAARRAGLTPRVVVPVDLFGLAADYPAIGQAAAAEGLTVVADAAQSFGSIRDGVMVGTLAPFTAVSFFPAKPLGCYGDGGAVFTDSHEAAEVLRSLRVHGQGAHKYENVRVGMNSRLDTLQAAVLLVKLTVYREELAARARIAARYSRGLADMASLDTPLPADGNGSAWAQYTIRTPVRDALADALAEQGIPTAVYYPVPLHLQPAYRDALRAAASLPVAEALAGSVLSLPMHPYLDEGDQDRIIEAIRGIVERELG